MTIGDFGDDVQGGLAAYLAPAAIKFRGSFASRTFDEFSDVDLQIRMDGPLDAAWFAGLEDYLQQRYGAALIRYDPDFRHTTAAQDVRFSFYRLPVYWRLDILVESRRTTPQKYPDPFPEWSAGTSALMNVIWSLKYLRRERVQDADRLLSIARQKIGLQGSGGTIEEVLQQLAQRHDVDSIMLSKTRDAFATSHTIRTRASQ